MYLILSNTSFHRKKSIVIIKKHIRANMNKRTTYYTDSSIYTYISTVSL